MIEDIKKKYPINSRGMTVIPCFTVIPENMENWMIGLNLTIGLAEPGTISQPAKLEGFDDTHLYLRVSGKRTKVPYDPEDIHVAVYQFEYKILFSNEMVAPREEIYRGEETADVASSAPVVTKKAPKPHTKRKADAPKPEPATPKKKAPAKRKQQKKSSQKQQPEKKPTKTASAPMKLFGIQRG